MAASTTDRPGTDDPVAQAKRLCSDAFPHAWQEPVVGDDELFCRACGLRVKLLALGDTKRFLTDEYLEYSDFPEMLTLSEAYDAALADARRRQSTR